VSAVATRLTGGQALVRALETQGTAAVFGLPGVQLDWAFDALYEARDAIAVYHTRHEQALSYMADGYARTTGRIGVCLAVPGPGVLNASAGLATAYACSSPVLCVTGQIRSDQIGAGRGALHEIKNQLEMLGSVTKWAARARRPDEVPTIVAEAFRQLRTGRPRPVAIEIPPDVLEAAGDVTPAPRVEVEPEAGDPDLLGMAAELLGRAARPIIFAGGGVLRSGAWGALERLAEMLEAPVIMSSNAKGALSDRHHLAHGLFAARELVRTSDVVFAVGTRFLQPANSDWGPAGGQLVVQLDIDPEEIGRNWPAAVGIVADADRGLEALLARVPLHNRKRESRRGELTALKRRAAEAFLALQPQGAFASAIRDALPDDGILVTDITQLGYWSWYGFPVYRPRTLVTAGYQGTLGFALPAALGAQVGNPASKVVVIAGDGGFMYNVQELATMVRHALSVVVIVFNDNAFGNVRRIQQEAFGGRTIASDLRNPDFVRLAESFGIDGARVDGPEGLRRALEAALANSRPALIEVPVGEMPSPWPALIGGWRP